MSLGTGRPTEIFLNALGDCVLSSDKSRRKVRNPKHYSVNSHSNVKGQVARSPAGLILRAAHRLWATVLLKTQPETVATLQA